MTSERRGEDAPGFFIPHRYAARLRPQAFPGLEPIFEAAAPRFDRVLSAIAASLARLRDFQGPPPLPRFDQDWFPRLDAAAAYAMVGIARPRRILEIGSGHSTRFLARALVDHGLKAEFICLDPAPRASLAGLPITWRAELAQDAPARLWRSLAPGDILFVDSSHIAQPGTDVEHLVGRVLPELAFGVHLHLHDVFLPEPYPEAWAWRGYNEQIVAAALLLGGAFELGFASRWIATRRGDRLRATGLEALPLVPGAFESSLWLRKRASTP